ncbi:MAG: HD domain-containing protein [Patescibacteria group bacterium]|jgi:poly(A) polymerase
MNQNPTENLKKYLDLARKSKTFEFLNILISEYPKASIYLVGGFVRDQILGLESKDLDFVVTKIKADDLKKFLGKYGSVELVGASFGVFKFVPKESEFMNQKMEAFDIALPRTEKSLGTGAYRDFDVQSDPELPIDVDLSRRDLTINAIAYDIKNDSIVDPYFGQKDLANKIIKAVGEPKQRFQEDYSRILRAIRFALKFNFQIEDNTWQAIKDDAPKILDAVPFETISKELLKSLDANPVRFLDLYDQSKLLNIILPEVEECKGVIQPKEFHEEGDVYEHTKLALTFIPKNSTVRFKLATLLHDIGKPSTTKTPEKDGVERVRSDEHAEVGAEITGYICNRLKLPNNLSNEIVWLVKYHMFFVSGKVEDMRPNTIKKYFIDNPKLGDELLDLYYVDTKASFGPTQEKNLARITEVRDYINNMREQFRKSEIKTFRHVIDGQDIMKEFNLKPGKEIGEYLEKADKFILEFVTKNGEEPSKEEVLKSLKS